MVVDSYFLSTWDAAINSLLGHVCNGFLATHLEKAETCYKDFTVFLVYKICLTQATLKKIFSFFSLMLLGEEWPNHKRRRTAPRCDSHALLVCL